MHPEYSREYFYTMFSCGVVRPNPLRNYTFIIHFIVDFQLYLDVLVLVNIVTDITVYSKLSVTLLTPLLMGKYVLHGHCLIICKILL